MEERDLGASGRGCEGEVPQLGPSGRLEAELEQSQHEVPVAGEAAHGVAEVGREDRPRRDGGSEPFQHGHLGREPDPRRAARRRRRPARTCRGSSSTPCRWGRPPPRRRRGESAHGCPRARALAAPRRPAPRGVGHRVPPARHRHSWSGSCGEVRQPVHRGPEPVGRRRSGPLEPLRVGELAPVVGVADQRPSVVERRELPAPQVARRWLAGLGGPPRDPPSLRELDDVVLPVCAAGQCHDEHVADRAHPLSGRRGGEVVVAVPPRLRRGVGDQREDVGRGRRNNALTRRPACRMSPTRSPPPPGGGCRPARHRPPPGSPRCLDVAPERIRRLAGGEGDHGEARLGVAVEHPGATDEAGVLTHAGTMRSCKPWCCMSARLMSMRKVATVACVASLTTECSRVAATEGKTGVPAGRRTPVRAYPSGRTTRLRRPRSPAVRATLNPGSGVMR